MNKYEIKKDFYEYKEEYKEEYKDLGLEQLVNDFFSNIFYEMQDEEDLNEVNEAEEEIRKELNLWTTIIKCS